MYKELLIRLHARSPFLAKHAQLVVKFAFCGGIGAIIDLGSLVLFVEVMDIQPKVAIVFSSSLSISFVFLANKFYTFKNKEKKYAQQFFRFLLVYGVAIMLNLMIAWFLLWLGVFYFLAKVVAIGSTAMWNYTLSHGFIFKQGEEIDVAVG